MTNGPSQYSYGHGGGRYFIAEVINRKDDEEQSGRCQIRIVGYQHGIPDDSLHWARPTHPLSNPMNGGIGGSVTGLMEGSFIMGQFADDGQQPIIHHVIGKAGKDNGQGGLDQTGRNHDTNKHSRDESHQGGDKRYDKETKDYGDKSSMEHTRSEAKNPYGRAPPKDGDIDSNKSWSLGMSEYK